jgi:hemerythrin
MPLAPLVWHDDLLVGCEKIDSQHQHLLSLAAALATALSSGAAAAALEASFTALADFARHHFTAEEGLMLSAGYPDYARHREEHERLLAQLALVRSSLPQPTASDLLVTVITAWTIPHMRAADKQLALFLQRTGFAVT